MRAIAPYRSSVKLPPTLSTRWLTTREVKMHVGNGKTFTVLAPEVSAENIYIQSVKLNGQPYDKSYITHEQIMSGATLEFVMGSQPGPVWYTNE